MNIAQEADLLFYRDFDPFHFFRIAAVLDGARRKTPPELVAKVGETFLSDHPIQTGMKEEFGECIGVHIHLLRLQASETAISLLCGGHPHDPFLRFVDQVRYGALYKIFDNIHNQQVPTRLRLNHSGVPITDFSAWLEYKLFGSFDAIEDDVTTRAGLRNFFSEEAALCSKRHLINSIKHGCRVGPGQIKATLNPHDAVGDKFDFDINSGARWFAWAEGKSSAQLEVGVQEIAPETDMQQIFHGAVLMQAMRDLRLARLEGRTEMVTVSLPDRMDRKKPLATCVARFKVNFLITPETA